MRSGDTCAYLTLDYQVLYVFLNKLSFMIQNIVIIVASLFIYVLLGFGIKKLWRSFNRQKSIFKVTPPTTPSTSFSGFDVSQKEFNEQKRSQYEE